MGKRAVRGTRFPGAGFLEKVGMRAFAFPGNANMPACRVRENSPHIRTFRRLAERMMLGPELPEIGSRRIKAFGADGRPVMVELRSGLAFTVSNTATFLMRIVESMGAEGKALFWNRKILKGGEETKATGMLLSFADMLRIMGEQMPANALDDAEALMEKGVLVRARKIALAVRAESGGFLQDECGGVYVLPRPVELGRIVLLCAATSGLVREIINAEAGYEAGREGGRYQGREADARRMLRRRWKYELRMSWDEQESP